MDLKEKLSSFYNEDMENLFNKESYTNEIPKLSFLTDVPLANSTVEKKQKAEVSAKTSQTVTPTYNSFKEWFDAMEKININKFSTDIEKQILRKNTFPENCFIQRQIASDPLIYTSLIAIVGFMLGFCMSNLSLKKISFRGPSSKANTNGRENYLVSKLLEFA